MRCVPRILANRNRRLGGALGRDDLRELGQDVLALVLEKLPTFLGEASLETWVWHFCVLSLLNRVRRVRRRATVGGSSEAEEASDRSASPSEHRLDRLDVDAIHEELDRLPEAEAAVIRAKHFGEMTLEESAMRIGASTNTVKSRYYRGLERMRAALARRFEGRGG
ncbi:MAG: RNA polymerase sigma factor [Planctomycetota bacterium JB042]